MTTDPIPPPPAPEPTSSSDGTQSPAFQDEELVYVDPETRTVVGRVEWSRSGNPKSMAVPPAAAPAEKGERRRSGRRFYPWGTYRSMRNVFKLEGKKRLDPNKQLDDVLEKALKEAFWD